MILASLIGFQWCNAYREGPPLMDILETYLDVIHRFQLSLCALLFDLQEQPVAISWNRKCLQRTHQHFQTLEYRRAGPKGPLEAQLFETKLVLRLTTLKRTRAWE